MKLAKREHEVGAAFRYHLLRSALADFRKNPNQLDSQEYEQAYQKATKGFEVESLVLSSREARDMCIFDRQIDQSVEQVASRYESTEEFVEDLSANDLDVSGLRQALQRELIFDGVMQRVAARAADVSDVDVRVYYEMHRERFEAPEQRVASHILITVNPDFPENTPEATRARMAQVMNKLGGRIKRFGGLAKRFSECPTAMDGGRLGDVKRGQLFPELDNALFEMAEGDVSPIIETQMGLHILLCERVKPGKRLPFSKAAPGIREFLQQRQRRNCQKAWLANLRKGLGS